MAEQTGAHVYAPGVQSLWIGFYGTGPLYWGTAVTAPEFEEMPKYLEVMNDLSGRQEAHQLIYDGTSALITVTVNRLDLGVTRSLRDAAERQGVFNAGKDNYLARGSLVLGRSDFSVTVANQFANTVQASPGLNAGRRYYSCTLMGYKESAVGTRAMEVAVVFRAWGRWLGPGLGHALYTEDPAELGNLILG
jgi:hypothetical protein